MLDAAPRRATYASAVYAAHIADTPIRFHASSASFATFAATCRHFTFVIAAPAEPAPPFSLSPPRRAAAADADAQ
jgi:hypothetical protein